MKKNFIKSIAFAAMLFATTGVCSVQANAAWKQSSNGWNYTEGVNLATGWRLIDGKWYYFNNQGIMQTGWLRLTGNWYYLASSGVMHTGWLQDGGKWYYMQSSGVMHTGWLEDGGKKYYMLPDGSMFNGERTSIACVIYTFDSTGACTGKVGEVGSSNVEAIRAQQVDNVEIEVVDHLDIDTSKYNPVKTEQSTTSSSATFTTDPERTIKLNSDEFLKIYRKEFYRLLNEYRKDNGLEVLESDKDLEKASLWKCKHMEQNNYFAHDYKGIKYYDLVEQNTGVKIDSEICHKSSSKGSDPNSLWSEKGVKFSAQEAFEGWKNSPKHNEIMLNTSIKFVGVSSYDGPNGGYDTAQFSY